MTTTKTNAKYTGQGGYTLRSHVENGGEETTRMHGTLCRDSRAVATYRNDGCGGSSTISFIDREERERYEAFALTQPSVHAHGMDLPMDGDFFLTMLASEFSANKRIARASKTKTCYLLPGEDLSAGWRVLSIPFGPAAEKFLSEKYGPHGWDLVAPWEAK